MSLSFQRLLNFYEAANFGPLALPLMAVSAVATLASTAAGASAHCGAVQRTGNGDGAAASSALMHAVRVLREAVEDAETAVAWRLGDPSEWAPLRRVSDDSRSAASGSPTPAAPYAPPEPPRLESPPTVSPPSSGAAAPAWPGPLRSVLVVDDEPVNTALVARRLKRDAPDVSVTTADDGSDMVDLTVTQRRRYDVVLLDEHMRGMNGTQAVAALRAHEASAALPRMTVLACTGNVCEPDLARFASAGFDGVMTKPLDMAVLVPTLAALVDPAGGGPPPAVRMFGAGDAAL